MKLECSLLDPEPRTRSVFNPAIRSTLLHSRQRVSVQEPGPGRGHHYSSEQQVGLEKVGKLGFKGRDGPAPCGAREILIKGICGSDVRSYKSDTAQRH